MFHKIKNANPLQDFRLCVLFSEGVTKIYDVKPLFEKISAFKVFAETPKLFFEARVDTGGYGVVWNDDVDLSCDELYENGVQVKPLLTTCCLLEMLPSCGG